MAKIKLDFTTNQGGDFERLPSIETPGIYTMRVAGVNTKDIASHKFGLIMNTLDDQLSTYVNISILKTDGTKNGFATFTLGNLYKANGLPRPAAVTEVDTDDFKDLYAIVKIEETQFQGKINYQANILDIGGPSYFDLKNTTQLEATQITNQYLEDIAPHVAEIEDLLNISLTKKESLHDINLGTPEKSNDSMDFDDF